MSNLINVVKFVQLSSLAKCEYWFDANIEVKFFYFSGSLFSACFNSSSRFGDCFARIPGK